jgi:hypothetical protein
MPFSDSTLSEIRAELVTLHQWQVRISERVKALESILEPFDFGQMALGFAPAPPEPPLQVAITENVRVQDSVGANTGLRARVLDTLKKHGPMRAPQVARYLTSEGYEDDSKTPLSTRIYNDLWRMSEKKLIGNENGMFSVK